MAKGNERLNTLLKVMEGLYGVHVGHLIGSWCVPNPLGLGGRFIITWPIREDDSWFLIEDRDSGIVRNIGVSRAMTDEQMRGLSEHLMNVFDVKINELLKDLQGTVWLPT